MIKFSSRIFSVVWLALFFSSLAHANIVGNIKCGTDNTGGERIVCDYAIIGFKYQKLFDTQFSNGRDSEVEIRVKKDVVAGDSLQCVETVIDSQVAMPTGESVKAGSAPTVTNSDKTDLTQQQSRIPVNLPNQKPQKKRQTNRLLWRSFSFRFY